MKFYSNELKNSKKCEVSELEIAFKNLFPLINFKGQNKEIKFHFFLKTGYVMTNRFYGTPKAHVVVE